MSGIQSIERVAESCIKYMDDPERPTQACVVDVMATEAAIVAALRAAGVVWRRGDDPPTGERRRVLCVRPDGKVMMGFYEDGAWHYDSTGHRMDNSMPWWADLPTPPPTPQPAPTNPSAP